MPDDLTMIIKLFLFQPLGPAIILVGGILILQFARRLAARRAAQAGLIPRVPGAAIFAEPQLFRLRLLVALLTLLAAALLLFTFRRPSTAHMTLSWSWQPLTVAGSVLQWRMDSWNWLTGLLILLICTAAVLLDADPPAEGSSATTRRDRIGIGLERTLGLGAAALIFTSSGNVLTLASSWLVLDGALGWCLRPAERAEPASRAWGLLSLSGVLLLGVLALLGEGGLRADLTTPSMDFWEIALLWLAALIRAGVYPLHLWLIGPGRVNSSGRLVLSALAPMAGLWMLARIHAIASADWLHRPEWAALGAASPFGTALVAWTETDETWRLRWIAINRASLVVLAAYMAGLAAPETLAWALVMFALGYTLFAVGREARVRRGWQAPVWLAAVALWGLPGTPGFLARSALVYPTELPWAIPLFGLIVLAEALLVAALWQSAAGAPEAQPVADSPTRSRRTDGWQPATALGLAIVALAMPLILWGLLPNLLARAAGWPAGEAFPSLWAAVTHARRSVWAGLGLSAALGVPLGLFRTRIFAGMHGWQRGVTGIVSLNWLYRAVDGGLKMAGGALQYFARLGEGEGYLGWLALAGLLLWVLLRG